MHSIDREELEERSAIMAWATFYRHEYGMPHDDAMHFARKRMRRSEWTMYTPLVNRLAAFHLQRLLRGVT